MAAPIVYRWDDVGAPVARGEQQSLIEVLTACLVTGYGSKAPAGWTREFVDVGGTKAAFRNNPNTGTGYFIQIDSTYGAANENAVMGFETMTSETEGLSPLYASSLYIRLGHAIGTTPREWVIVADDLAFYLVVAYYALPLTDDFRTTNMFFGDGVEENPNDSYFCMLSAHESNTDSNGTYGYLQLTSSSTTSISDGFLVSRNSAGASQQSIIALIQGGGPGSTDYMGAYGKPWSVGDPLYLSRPYINDGVAYSIRGYLPGLYYPCHPYPFGMLEEVTVSGSDMTFISMKHNARGNTTQVNYLLLMDDWRI